MVAFSWTAISGNTSLFPAEDHYTISKSRSSLHNAIMMLYLKPGVGIERFTGKNPERFHIFYFLFT